MHLSHGLSPWHWRFQASGFCQRRRLPHVAHSGLQAPACQIAKSRAATALQDHIGALKAKLLAADARLDELEGSNHDLQSQNQVMDGWMHLLPHMEGLTKALRRSQALLVECALLQHTA